MVPENEFHHKEQPVRSATPGTVQNGPGKTAASAGKTEEGAADDSGEFGFVHPVFWDISNTLPLHPSLAVGTAQFIAA